MHHCPPCVVYNLDVYHVNKSISAFKPDTVQENVKCHLC